MSGMVGAGDNLGALTALVLYFFFLGDISIDRLLNQNGFLCLGADRRGPRITSHGLKNVSACSAERNYMCTALTASAHIWLLTCSQRMASTGQVSLHYELLWLQPSLPCVLSRNSVSYVTSHVPSRIAMCNRRLWSCRFLCIFRVLYLCSRGIHTYIHIYIYI